MIVHCKTLWIMCVAGWLLSVAVQAQAAEVAGYVTRIRGEVSVQSAAGRQTLTMGQVLHLGDRIVTGADARLEARMRDGMVITLGENTEFVVQQVMGVTSDSKNSVFELLKGVFRSVTHWAEPGSQQQEPCRVETPVATIGIRGTEVWGGFNLLDAGGRTLDVVMLSGKGVYVENAGRRVELTQGGQGTTIRGAEGKPLPAKSWGDAKLQAALRTVAW